jgi:hypothetical protein
VDSWDSSSSSDKEGPSAVEVGDEYVVSRRPAMKNHSNSARRIRKSSDPIIANKMMDEYDHCASGVGGTSGNSVIDSVNTPDKPWMIVPCNPFDSESQPSSVAFNTTDNRRTSDNLTSRLAMPKVDSARATEYVP